MGSKFLRDDIAASEGVDKFTCLNVDVLKSNYETIAFGCAELYYGGKFALNMVQIEFVTVKSVNAHREKRCFPGALL